jgi:hypothetical protein
MIILHNIFYHQYSDINLINIKNFNRITKLNTLQEIKPNQDVYNLNIF